MTTQAPLEFIQDYYQKRLDRRKRFVDAKIFYENQLKNVSGDKIVNIGCGPQFYDDLMHFGSVPREYIGLDFNLQNFEFLKHSKNHSLLDSKSFAISQGVKIQFVCEDIFEITPVQILFFILRVLN